MNTLKCLVLGLLLFTQVEVSNATPTEESCNQGFCLGQQVYLTDANFRYTGTVIGWTFDRFRIRTSDGWLALYPISLLAHMQGCTFDRKFCVGNRGLDGRGNEVTLIGIYATGLVLLELPNGFLIKNANPNHYRWGLQHGTFVCRIAKNGRIFQASDRDLNRAVQNVLFQCSRADPRNVCRLSEVQCTRF